MKNSFFSLYSKGAQIFPFTETAIRSALRSISCFNRKLAT